MDHRGLLAVDDRRKGRGVEPKSRQQDSVTVGAEYMELSADTDVDGNPGS